LNHLKNTVESHSWRLEQVEDRISGHEDKIDIYEKTEEYPGKRLKSYERYMQELCDSNKRPNLLIMGVKEGEEGQVKVIHNLFNKIIA
jgi:hypothetical protein